LVDAFSVSSTRSEIFDAEAIQTPFMNNVKRAVECRQTWFEEWDIIGNINRAKSSEYQ